MSSTSSPPPALLTERIEGNVDLDPMIEAIDRLVPESIRQGPLRSVLAGEWLGHAVHPIATDLPIGCWVSASLLDIFGGASSRRAARGLVGWGIVLSVPAALTGLSDWSHLSERDRRVGLIHAQCNAVALGLYGLSYVARRRAERRRRKGKANPNGRDKAGILLALAASGVLSAGGYLGGHLAIKRGVTAGNALFHQHPGERVPRPAAA